MAPRVRPIVTAIAAFTLGLSAFALPIPATPAQAATAAATASGCVPVAVLAFRGSDSKNIDPSVTSNAGKAHRYGASNLVTNGWEGQQFTGLFKAFSEISYPDGFRADSVPVIGIGPKDSTVTLGYDAPPAYSEIWNRLNLSAIDGAKAAVKTMQDFQTEHGAGCRTPTKFVVTGYSQGAMAARYTAQMNTRDVIAAINIGDADQKPNAAGNIGSAPDGNGVVRAKWPILNDVNDRYYDLPLVKTATCHNEDPICDFRWGTAWRMSPVQLPGVNAFEHHESYYTSAHPEESPARSKQIADISHGLWVAAQNPTPPVPLVPADIMFAIDTTGSMGGYIDAAKATAQTVAEQTLARAPGSRVGLVEFKDYVDSTVYRTVVPLTSTFSSLTDGLAQLSADGGGDYPEAVYSGIVEAAHADWASKSRKSIIVIGDAPPHDPEPVTGYTAASVVQVLKNRLTVAPRGRAKAMVAAATTDDQTIALYVASAGTDLSAAMQPISDATGGKVLPISDGPGLEDAIRQAIEDTTQAPSAALTATTAVAGEATTISGLGSTADDPKTLAYKFDLDGDGVFETSSADGLVTKVFATAGPKPVSIEVTDLKGRTGTASLTIDVHPAEAAVASIDLAKPTVTVSTVATVLAGQRAATSAVGGTASDYLLVASTGDPFAVGPNFAASVPTDWQTAGLLIPAGTPAGKYRLLVGTVEGAWGLAPLTVTSAGTPGTGTDPGTGGTPSTAPPGSGSPSQGTPTSDKTSLSSQAMKTRALGATGMNFAEPVAFAAILILLGSLLFFVMRVLIARSRRTL